MSTRKINLNFLTVSSSAILLALLISGHAAEKYFPPPEGQGGWRKNQEADFVRSLGLDPVRLEEFGQFNLSVPNSNWQPYAGYKGILVIKDGWIVGEWYNRPEAKDFPTYLSSNGKSVAIAAFGILAEDSRRAKLPVNLDEHSRLYDRRWLPQGFPLSDPAKENITFERVFQHTSGLCPERTREGKEVEQGRNQWDNYTEWVVGHDPEWPQTSRLYFPPGQPGQWPGAESWGSHMGGYSSVAFCHLGLVFQNLYEQPAAQFVWERLLRPIGCSKVDFHAPPSSEIRWFSAGGLRLTPRDYARFAYLLLRKGKWGRERVVPGAWIERFASSISYPNVRSNRDHFFGDYPTDMFRIAGSGLNWAFIIPSLDLIAVRSGRASNQQWDEVEEEFLGRLFKAVLE